MATTVPSQTGETIHGGEPPVEPPDTEQQPATSDHEPPSDDSWRQWMMVGVGLVCLLSVLALIVSAVALSSHNPRQMVMPGISSASAPVAPAVTQAVSLTVKGGDERAKLGTDGKYHDAFLPGDFTIRAGARVTLTVLNYDPMPHSFTSSTLSPSELINATLPAGSPGAPSQTTFTFTASSAPGKYAWWCALPCDPWSMSHDGFMRGYVTVVA